MTGLLLALAAVATLCAPSAFGAHEASTAARIKQCKHRYAGKKKSRLQAKKRCVRKARQRPKPVPRRESAPSRSSGSGSSNGSAGGGSSAAPAPGGEPSPSPGPPAPEGAAPLEVTAADASVAVGSTVILASPEPLISLTAIAAPVSGAEPGISATAEDGGVRFAATAGAAVGSMALTLEGSGCTASGCDRSFVIHLRLTVEAIEAPPGNLEGFSSPSPDRIAAVTEDQLPDEVLVMLGTTADPGTRGEAEDAAQIVGAVVAGGLFEEGIYQLRWATPQNIPARIAELEGLPYVTAVTPSYVGTTEPQSAYAPFVGPTYDQSYWTWRYEQVHALQAWSQSNGVGVTVGIIDGGNAFAGSPDLNVTRTLNPIVVPAAHATNVAGLACGKPNGSGMVGLAWGCPIVSTYVEGEGGRIADADFMAAMQRMIKSPGVRVVNISMGWESGCATQAVRNQIEAWITHSKVFFRRFLAGPGSNIVWTFSAGNNCMYGPSSPFAANDDLPNVLDVAATNADGRLASFSNYGVDVAAPGGVEPSSPPIDLHASCDRDDVLNAGRCGLLSSTVGACPSGYCAERGEMAGTSMAAPVVAGVAALVASKHPQFSAAQIGTCIKSTAGSDGVGSTGPPDGQPGGAYANPPLSYGGAPIPIVNAAAAVGCTGGVSTVELSPHGPTSGPAGFGLEVPVPTCTYLAVSFDGQESYVLGAYSPSMTFDPVTPSTLPPGRHQMSFACRDDWYGEPVWTSPGFEVTVTGGPIPLGLESHTAPAGGEFVYTSGPSLSATQCPSLPGVSIYGLSLYIDSGDGLRVVTSTFVLMPDGRATEGLLVPPDTPPGDYLVLERCFYTNVSGEIGLFEFAWEWPNATVTDGSGTSAGGGAPDRREAPAWPTVASPSTIFGPMYIRGGQRRS